MGLTVLVKPYGFGREENNLSKPDDSMCKGTQGLGLA